MTEYKIVTASDDLPGTATIVDEQGKSILAIYDNTPIFHSRMVADRVLAMLNAEPKDAVLKALDEYVALPDPLSDWFRKIGTSLSGEEYEEGIQAIAACVAEAKAERDQALDALRQQYELAATNAPYFPCCGRCIEGVDQCVRDADPDGPCNQLVIGPDTDGEPCDWCQNCGEPSADHRNSRDGGSDAD